MPIEGYLTRVDKAHYSAHANGEPLLNWSSSHSHSSVVLQQFYLLSGLPMGITSKPVPRSFLLNDDTYRGDCATIIVSYFEEKEQGVRKSFIYSMRKAFLEHAVVKLVYKFDKKSTSSV